MQHQLSQGVLLTVDHDRCDYNVLFPLREDVNINVGQLDKELLRFGLELVDEAEDPPEFVSEGLKVTCAIVYGGN